jgi:hypothetical protein
MSRVIKNQAQALIQALAATNPATEETNYGALMAYIDQLPEYATDCVTCAEYQLRLSVWSMALGANDQYWPPAPALPTCINTHLDAA